MTSSTTRYESLLGRRIEHLTPIAGGDIGQSACLALEDGTRCFAKHYSGASASMARAEAAGLDWLRAAEAMRVPEVIAISHEDPAILVLEWIESRDRAADYDEAFGRGLAALHRSGAPGFGFASDNFIGTLPQRNLAHARWADFYARERIAPQVEKAARAGHLPGRLVRDLERLVSDMHRHCGPDEPPARLHGDLWAGNHLADEQGRPCLIDPAVYGGHREIDLAMMKLFGGFSARVFDAYAETAPLSAGAQERVALYQLYPLLVHVNLFGGGYVGPVADAVRSYA